MSFVVGDKELAKYSNLINDSDKTIDSPSILMNKSEEFFRDLVDNKDTIEILKTNK